MKAGSQILLLNPEQIQELEEFILEIPGKFANPILAKLHSYKRTIKADKSGHFSDTGQKLAETPEDSTIEKQEPES